MTDSIYKKIKDALDLAIMANVGVTFTPPDAFALLVIMESLEKLRSELTALREQVRWIPVSKRVPDKNDCVIDASGRLVPFVLGCVNGSVYGLIHIDYFDINTTYTHWMPLPQPPEGE